MKNEPTPALTPKLRFPEFRDAAGWLIDSLGSIVTKVGSGITPTGGDSNYRSSGRPFVRSQNVGWGELILDDVVFIDDETHRTFAATEVRLQDVLLNITGASIGRSAVADSRIAGGNVNQHVCIIRSDEDILEPRFLNQFLLSNYGQTQIDSFQAGGNRQGLNFAQVRSFSIPLPPTATEQQKIADCLSSVDELIAAQARKVDALKSHKKGLMQQLFPREGETQPRLRFPEFQDAGEWVETNLGEIVEVASGQVDPTELPYCDFPQIGSENIESNTGKLVNVRSAGAKGVKSGNYAFDESDVLYSKIRPALNKVAAPGFKGICSADIYPIRPANSDLLRSYLLYLLLSQKFLEYAIRNSERGKIPKINRDGLLTYVAMIPSPAEQQRIADCLTSLDDLIAAQTQKHEALRNHKKALMQQLFPSPEEVEA